MPQPTQKRGAKKVSSPEQRLEKIRSDREKNHADQNTLQQRLSELKKADAVLEQEESQCVMQIISRNAAQRYGENYTTAQLLEYLNSVESGTTKLCIEATQGEPENVGTAGESDETEPCIGTIQGEEEPEA